MKFFLDRYAKLGEKVPSKVTLKPTFRVNTLRIDEQNLVQRMKDHGVKLEKVGWLRNGYSVSHSKFSLGASTEALLGYIYLQEAAAQLPVDALNPKADEFVLDCCAAPGGKTTQIAQRMQNTGTLVALEKRGHRLLSLRNNLERMGISNTVVYHMDAVKAGKLGIQFDKILLDAPCSGNFVTDSEWFKKRSLNDIKRSGLSQRPLIKAALSVLKPGGALVYSTCSLEPEENELNMQWLLDTERVSLEPAVTGIGDPGLTTVFGQRLHPSIMNCRRFWPHKTQTEGFFIAKVRKR